MELGGVFDIQLAADAEAVAAHGGLAEMDGLGDVAGLMASGEETKDFELAITEQGKA